jgi:hypothetical protein
MAKRKVRAKDLINDADEYIRTADPPILAEYAHIHGITRQYLYQLADIEKKNGKPELSDTLKKISEAKEIKLEKKGLSGEYAPNVAIFSLKQLGWSDKQEITANSNGMLADLIDGLKEPEKKEE